MKASFELRRYLPWLNLPLGLLVALLQRTPAVRMFAAAGDYVLASRAGELLRAAFTLATLGALHSRAGATTFVVTPNSPIQGTVGTRLDVAFTYNGTPSSPARFQVSGSLPPGLSFIPAPNGGTINSGSPAITGTPTQAGTFTIFVQGFNSEGLTNNVQQEIRFVVSSGVTVVAPGIATPPQGQTVSIGSSVTFTVQVTGTPTPTLQWTKNNANIGGATGSSLTLPNVQASDAGSYAVIATNSAGSITSTAATLVVNPVIGNLAITTHPASQTIATGSTVAFNVGATGATGFQWRRNTADLPGANGATLVINAASAANAGDYTVVVSGTGGSTTSNAATLSVSNGADLGRLINLSILTAITAADPVFTLGTVVGGAGSSGSKPLLVRAAGPALTQLGVGGALPDPKLELFTGPTVASTNDDWGGTVALVEAFSQVGAFPYAVATSKDSASFNATTAAGAYTIQVSGVSGATGAVIAELYDASPNNAVTPSTPRLVNVSVLKQIGSGTVLTAGFIVGGGSGAAKTVLIRAIGPTLSQAPFSVGGAMADPKLELYRGATVIASNDNWGGEAQLTAVGTAVGAFAISNPASRDAILVVTLPPGSYTAEVSGIGGGGAALVEVYEVP
jgi:hypothetical protein